MKELKNIKIEKGLNESLIVKGKVPLGVWLKIQVPGFKELYGRFKRKGRGLNAEYTKYDFIASLQEAKRIVKQLIKSIVSGHIR